MLKPKVTIITVVRNAKEPLMRTIENVSQIKYDNLEYVVIDGASTDGTKEVIEQNSIHISHWISEEDRGVYDAMNKALKLAAGDYVWFVNAGDMVYSPDILNNIFSGIENYSDIYYGDTVILSEELEIKGLRGKQPPKRLSVASFRYGMSVCHQSIIVKKEIAPFYNLDYRYSSDIDWVMNAVRNAKSITNCHTVFSYFVEGGISSQKKKKSLEERYAIMVKHYGVFSTILNHLIIALKYFKPKYRKL